MRVVCVPEQQFITKPPCFPTHTHTHNINSKTISPFVGAADDCIPLGAGGWQKCPQPRNPHSGPHKSSSATAATVAGAQINKRTRPDGVACLSHATASRHPGTHQLSRNGHDITRESAFLVVVVVQRRPSSLSGMRFNAEKGGNGHTVWPAIASEAQRDFSGEMRSFRLVIPWGGYI